MKYIIVYGDPVDGFNFRGPFDTSAEAVEYASIYHDGAQTAWWIAELNPRSYTTPAN